MSPPFKIAPRISQPHVLRGVGPSLHPQVGGSNDSAWNSDKCSTHVWSIKANRFTLGVFVGNTEKAEIASFLDLHLEVFSLGRCCSDCTTQREGLLTGAEEPVVRLRSGGRVRAFVILITSWIKLYLPELTLPLGLFCNITYNCYDLPTVIWASLFAAKASKHICRARWRVRVGLLEEAPLRGATESKTSYANGDIRKKAFRQRGEGGLFLSFTVR